MGNNNLVDTSLTLHLNRVATSYVNEEGTKTELITRVSDDQSKMPLQNEQDDLITELNQVRVDNKKIREMVMSVYENCISIRKDLTEMMQKCSHHDHPSPSSKRKLEEYDEPCGCALINIHNSECANCQSSPTTPKEINSNISKVYCRVDPSDTSLVVKDGYQWRKYGQKVTRDNSSPRAYYKCSFAPTCPVKKKVQRSAVDKTILVVSYEGKHKHNICSSDENSPNSKETPTNPSSNRLSPSNNNNIEEGDDDESTGLQQLLVAQMAASLTRNPTFTSALATAISEKIFTQELLEDNI